MRGFAVLIGLAVLSGPARGAESLSFVKVPQGARSAAMGGAFSMVPASAEALWYNPAGAAGLRGMDLRFSHLAWIGETSNEYLTGAWGNGRAAAGVFLQYAGTNDVSRDAFGVEGADFGVSAMTAGLSGGYAFKRLRLGIGARLLQQSVAGAAASGFAGDVGAQADLWRDKVVLSFSALNLGSAPEPGSMAEPVMAPQNLRAGLGLLGAAGFSLLAEYRHWTAGGQGGMALGGEYALRQGSMGLAGRLGYESDLSGGEAGAGLSTGVGIKFGDLSLDYGFQTLGDLGAVHRATLGWSFRVRAVEAEPGPKASTTPAKVRRRSVRSRDKR